MVERLLHPLPVEHDLLRLHTVLTTLLEDTLFELPELQEKKIVFDRERVKLTLDHIVADEDLRKYIL